MVLPSSALTLTAISKLAGLVVNARSPVGRLTLVTDPLLAVKVWLNAVSRCDRALWETVNVTFVSSLVVIWS